MMVGAYEAEDDHELKHLRVRALLRTLVTLDYSNICNIVCIVTVHGSQLNSLGILQALG